MRAAKLRIRSGREGRVKQGSVLNKRRATASTEADENEAGDAEQVAEV